MNRLLGERLATIEPRLMDALGVVLIAIGANEGFTALTSTGGCRIITLQLASFVFIEMLGIALVMIGQELIAYRERERAADQSISRAEIYNKAIIYITDSARATFEFRLWLFGCGTVGLAGLWIGNRFSEHLDLFIKHYFTKVCY
jgi:hypothetical protein